MKTADDWYLSEDMLRNLKWRPETVIGLIKAIQLDSWKQGMTDAAEIALGGSITSPSIAGLILAARDKKETI